MDQLTFFAEEPPANPSQSQDSEEEWMTSAVTWRSNILNWLREKGPAGWFGRTSLACCLQMEDGTLAPSSEAWPNSGMGGPTESLMLSTSEFPSGAAASSLLDILEIGDLPPRYSLSATACKGILRRAARRGKELPPQLRLALLSVSQGSTSEALECEANVPVTARMRGFGDYECDGTASALKSRDYKDATDLVAYGFQSTAGGRAMHTAAGEDVSAPR